MKSLSLLVCGSGLIFQMYAQTIVPDKKTVMTISAPIKVPSATTELPAGKYIIRLMELTGTRNIVQIYNEREDKLLATALAIPNYRLQPSGKTSITFWEAPVGEPEALRSWFYPGDMYGVEFAYPPKAASVIARRSKQNIPTVYSESDKTADLKDARIGLTTPEGKEAELDKQSYSNGWEKK